MPMSLKAARVNIGLSQIGAAKKLGISVDTLSKYERGRSFPSVPILDRILELYKINYDDLIFLSRLTV